MSATKTIGVLTALGGIAFIGWFALNKFKPQLSEIQLDTLKKSIEDKSIAVLPDIKTPLEQWKIKYASMNALEKAKLNKEAIANMGFSVSSTGTIDYSLTETGQKKRVEQDYPINSIDGVNDCKALDITLRDITLKIAEEGKKLLGKNSNKSYLEALIKRKVVLQNYFVTNKCATKIENERLDESGLVSTKQAIEVEQSLKNNSIVDQNIYLGTGSLLLITGLFILLKK